jgi:hypothetical protein
MSATNILLGWGPVIVEETEACGEQHAATISSLTWQYALGHYSTGSERTHLRLT